MRISKPGQIKRRGNLKTENEAPAQPRQISTKGKHFPTPMLYGRSRKSGRKSGGYYWNPPMSCEQRVLVDFEIGDRWVDVALCRACPQHKKGGCEAYEVKCSYEEMNRDD